MFTSKQRIITNRRLSIYTLMSWTDPDAFSGASFGAATANWTTAKAVEYIPFALPFPLIVDQLSLRVTNSTGNFDIGIYDATGAKLISTGTQSLNNTLKDVDVTDTYLQDGLYYFACTCDSTTSQVERVSPGSRSMRFYGTATETTGSFGLPTTATFAADTFAIGVPALGMLVVNP